MMSGGDAEKEGESRSDWMKRGKTGMVKEEGSATSVTTTTWEKCWKVTIGQMFFFVFLTCLCFSLRKKRPSFFNTSKQVMFVLFYLILLIVLLKSLHLTCYESQKIAISTVWPWGDLAEMIIPGKTLNYLECFSACKYPSRFRKMDSKLFGSVLKVPPRLRDDNNLISRA